MKIRKKIPLLLLMAILAMSILSVQAAAESVTVSGQRVYVDDKLTDFDVYNIDGSNYFKLRDIAYVLNGTKAQFSVGYNPDTNVISVSKADTYYTVGGEMSNGGDNSATAVPSAQRLEIDGAAVTISAYNIGGNNYFKLRELGDALDFGVNWNEAAASVMITSSSSFEVHYIDVGQADAEVVMCDGMVMVIDGGNVADSSTVVSYLTKLGVDQIDYVVCTHAHEDHCGGLAGVMAKFSALKVFSPVTSYNTAAFSNFVKYTNAQNLAITTPEVGSSFELGGSRVDVLGPVGTYDDVNNTSIVMKITYGDTSFLFTGDAEQESESDILSAGYDVSSTVLKVGHHGSSSSTSYQFLYYAAPQYAVISVGTGNSYGHPAEAILSRLRDAGTTVYRTDMQGDIVAVSDGESVSFTTSKNAPPAAVNPTIGDSAGTYIGNARSLKFHLPTCSSLPAESNRVYFGSYEEASAGGYSPCGRCLG